MKLTPEVRSIELDVHDAPHNYYLATLDADGDLIDVETFTDSDKARAAADELVRASGLPYKVRHVPPTPY